MARTRAIYPQQLCRTICTATLELAKADAGDLVCIQCVDDGEEKHVNEVAFERPQWKSDWDDWIGRELRKDLVEAARAEELSVVKKMEVWSR